MSVTLTTMRYVVAIAEEGGFTRASKRLHVAQPALSRQVRRLEAELGAELFERRPTRLTTAGSVFVAGARRVLAQAERTVEETRAAGEGRSAEVRLGFTPTSAYRDAPMLIDAIESRTPPLEVVAEEGWPPELLGELAKGRLDLVLGRELGAQELGFLSATLYEEPLVAIVAAGHRLAGRSSVALRDLRGHSFRFFARKLSPVYHDAVISRLHATDERFEVRANPIPGLRHLSLRDGEGFTLLPRSVAGSLSGDVRAIPISDDLAPVRVEVAYTATSRAAAIEAVESLAGSRLEGRAATD